MLACTRQGHGHVPILHTVNFANVTESPRLRASLIARKFANTRHFVYSVTSTQKRLKFVPRIFHVLTTFSLQRRLRLKKKKCVQF